MNTTEFIAGAAVRYEGKIYESRGHYGAFELVAKEAGKQTDWEFWDLVDATSNSNVGFVTNAGRFVDREEAALIANAAQQILDQVTELTVEHLPKVEVM
jgi:hypothetical protein